jgi:hypothetical protein
MVGMSQESGLGAASDSGLAEMFATLHRTAP